MSRKDFQGWTSLRKAGFRRLQDAQALLDSDQPAERAQCAKYLAGYAVECKLKAIAMEIFRCSTLEKLAVKLNLSESDIFSHNLEKLAKTMPSLYNRLMQSEVRRTFASVNRWSPSWRYDPGVVNDQQHDFAVSFVHDVRNVYNWLEANRG